MAMAKNRSSTNKGKKKNIGGILNLNINIVVERLQKSLLSGKKFSEMRVPEDVKEGHFAVIAEEEDELKRFVVPLSYLTHPSFMRLLEQAAEEYGFGHSGGALTVPCRPAELERILAERWVEDRVSTVAGGSDSDKWGSSCSKTTVRSY